MIESVFFDVSGTAYSILKPIEYQLQNPARPSGAN